jgi:murein DD-endopeptidase / murein LD-carboxypeptidase
MRKLVIIPFCLFSFATGAQVTNPYVKPDTIVRDPAYTFFAHYGLNIDSAKTPQLYLDVFSWIGTRYQYGGHSRSGVDCSGFVSAVYRSSFCIQLSGGSLDLFSQVDTVPRTEFQPGDILFFKIKKGQISHVAIYLGNNKFAHASVHGGVMVNDLDEPYYRKYFFRGGRLRAPQCLPE